MPQGGDDLPGGNHPGDNANALLTLADGSTVSTVNINAGRGWGNGQTHMATLNFPAAGAAVNNIRNLAHDYNRFWRRARRR